MKRKITILTASSIVIANMIGTGVFTSIGYQLAAVQNSWTILFLWLAGGLLSLFGAFAYAELGTHFSESGGDYIYLSRVFHPLLGYLSAWAGLTVGFSAPVALAAMAFTKYMSALGFVAHEWMAVIVILLIGVMHSFTIKHSSAFQNISTAVKILFILALIALGLSLNSTGLNALHFDDSWKQELLTPGFAVSMVYVSFAYTGWNAAAYVVGEIDQPRRNLPRALIASTLFVACTYMLFQFVLLKHASVQDMKGKEDVTFIAFEKLLGTTGGIWVSVFIALQLIATISSYLWVGPRVTWAMANEFRLWKLVAKKNKHDVPVVAIWLHVVIALMLTLSGSFERVLLYAGFVLQLMSSLTVASSLFIKSSKADVFKSPMKPLLQVVFLLFNGWVLLFTFIDKPLESSIGIGMLAVGILLYFFDRPAIKKDHQ